MLRGAAGRRGPIRALLWRMWFARWALAPAVVLQALVVGGRGGHNIPYAPERVPSLRMCPPSARAQEHMRTLSLGLMIYRWWFAATRDTDETFERVWSISFDSLLVGDGWVQDGLDLYQGSSRAYTYLYPYEYLVPVSIHLLPNAGHIIRYYLPNMTSLPLHLHVTSNHAIDTPLSHNQVGNSVRSTRTCIPSTPSPPIHYQKYEVHPHHTLTHAVPAASCRDQQETPSHAPCRSVHCARAHYSGVPWDRAASQPRTAHSSGSSCPVPSADVQSGKPLVQWLGFHWGGCASPPVPYPPPGAS